MPKPKKPSKPAQDATPVIETIAKAMIPAVLGVAAICAITLAAIYFTRPAKSDSIPSQEKPRAQFKQPKVRPNELNPNLSPAQQAATDDIKTDAPPPTVKSPPSSPEVTTEPPIASADTNNQVGSNPADANPANSQPAIPPPGTEAAPKEQSAIATDVVAMAPAVIGKAKYKLSVAGGKIQFSSTDFDLGNAFPSVEKEGEFEYLHFNGDDQRLLLPEVQQSSGALVITARMKQRTFAVVLQSPFGRLLLRRKNDHLSWRIAGKSQIDDAREIRPFAGQQWHHIVMTWQDGGQAILYLDGQAVDQFDYIHEIKRFKFFRDVGLGRSVFKNETKYYPSDVHEVIVFDDPLSSEEVITMFGEKKSQFSSVFAQ